MLHNFIKTAALARLTIRGNDAPAPRLKVSANHRLAFEPLESRLLLDAGSLIINEFLAINEEAVYDYTDPQNPVLIPGLPDGDGIFSELIAVTWPVIQDRRSRAP